MGRGNDLLNNARSIKRIIAPTLNAFDKYDTLFELAKQQPKESLFLICLGPTATILAYDLAESGYQAIDSGHLDVEYEWFLKNADERIKIDGKYVLEAVGGTETGNQTDTEYENQIIASFT